MSYWYSLIKIRLRWNIGWPWQRLGVRACVSLEKDLVEATLSLILNTKICFYYSGV